MGISTGEVATASDIRRIFDKVGPADWLVAMSASTTQAITTSTYTKRKEFKLNERQPEFLRMKFNLAAEGTSSA